MSDIFQVTVLIGTIGYFTSSEVVSSYSDILYKSVPRMESTRDMFLHYRQVRITLRTLGLNGLDKENAEIAIKGVHEAIKNYEEADRIYMDLGFASNKQKELHTSVHKAWLDFKKVGGTALELYQSGKPEDQKKLTDIFLRICPEKAQNIFEAIEALHVFHEAEIATQKKAILATTKWSTRITWSVIIVAFVFGLVAGAMISISIAKELKLIVTDLIGNANEISGTVSDLTSSSEALSSAATAQASSIQQTASSIEEIRAMVQRNTDNAIESAQISAQSKEEANLGKQSVEDMIHAIQDIDNSNKNIQEEVQSGNQRIAEIVNVIHEIESKTKVINEIVFQTKLLSFNASVEAARAGEHGKGFAVVAEEIGNLANMSGNASKEITSLLTQSTAKVNEIVSETSDKIGKLMLMSRGKVEHGGQVAENCGRVLEKIVANADHLSQMVTSISSASQEQAAGVNEIVRAIQLLDETTQTNTAETHNTTSSASHLGDQVKSLNISSCRLRTLVDGGKTNCRNNNLGTIVNTFVWKDQYSLDIPKMDNEHKVLIEKINQLATSVNEGSNNQIISTIFKDLANYTKEHFSDEEAYLTSVQYPDLANHKVIHRKLVSQLNEFENDIASGKVDNGALVSFLNNWLVKHIMGVDMKYSRFVKTGTMNRTAHKVA